MNDETSPQANFDVLVVGAGIAGLYLLYRLRAAGLRVRVLEAASGVGGTWFWNRYPGARCDVDSMHYSYSFDDSLQQEWKWTERFSSQPEILNYLNHVADRYELRRNIQLETRVRSAAYDESAGLWRVETEEGETLSATFCVMATGCLSAANKPNIAGLDGFAGEVYHTANWPPEGVDFSGRRVGIIGTGSTAVQVIPIVAAQAAQLFVFQRTANYVIPARNHPLGEGEERETKAHYDEIRAFSKTTPGNFHFAPNPVSALATTPAERDEIYEAAWLAGGGQFMATFGDLPFSPEANKTAQDFVRAKIHQIVDDPDVARRLCPDTMIGCKRLSLGTDYYETYNRSNVELVDVSETPIGEITATGPRVGDKVYAIDALVLATGFDAMTGSLLRIDIRGRSGRPLADKWSAGPRTYLGLMTSGFPNLFTVSGPGSPSVLSNMMPTIEQHVEWITDCISYLRDQGKREIDADLDYENAWVEEVNDAARKTLRYTCSSWYLGANIPGKPRVFMPYIGGVPAYNKRCAEVVAAGYEGFRTRSVD